MSSIGQRSTELAGWLRRAPAPVRWGLAAGLVVLALVLSAGNGWGSATGAPAATPTVAAPTADGEYLIRSYDEITGTPAAPPAPEATSEIGLDLVLKLAIVVGLIYAGAFVLKRMGLAGRAPVLGGRQIRLIESQALGPQRSISIVEVGSRRFLVGMTAQQIQLLAELSAESAAAPTSDPWLAQSLDVDARHASGPASEPHRFASRAHRAARLRQAARQLDALQPRLQPI